MRARSYLALLALVGCAQARTGTADPDGGSGSGSADASCGTQCDTDHDGVIDTDDQCANTPMGEQVNDVGCADSQLTPTLVPFPPFNLMWTPTGELGRAGGLTWTYVGIERKDLFHIYWIVCDDPATPCALSLDGPIDAAAENWAFAGTNADLVAGKLVFTNTTHIALADTTMPQLDGRLTITIVDAADAVIPFASVSALGVTARSGAYGAEIKGTGFKIVALAEVKPTTSSTWTPYLDYYDAQPTPTTGGGVTTSFGGSFYAK
jgi:hypothetical protein